MTLAKTIERARKAAFLLRTVAAGEVATRIMKDDMGGGDLAAGGGLKAPEQGKPKKPEHVTQSAEGLVSPNATDLSVDNLAQQPNPREGVVKVVDFQGIPVHVDRPRGFVQNGIDDSGDPWKRIYHVDYGFVPNTTGGDQDDLDVFLGLDQEAKEAHWILQKRADGSFDEYKVMLGFPNADMAKGMYLAHVPKKFYGGQATTSIGMMKALLGLHPSETVKALKSFAIDGFGSVQKRIEQKTDGWHVYSEDGSKHLGGPYGSKEEAETRLKQVEGHKEKSVKLVSKAAPPGSADQQYILGVVLEPETVDAQGDIYSADEIRAAEWAYMTDFQNVGLMHKGFVNNTVELVESYIAPVEMNLNGSVIKQGTWLMGLHVKDPQLWAQVKRGELTGLSIGGFATKTPTAS
jgi:hypothetical protein